MLTVIAAAVLLAGTASSQDRTAQYKKGWPSKDAGIDIREGFVNPPKGYGNVPFYWWCGDNLDLDRLTEQLEILSSSATDGLCVSYNHSHPQVDLEFNSQGYGGYGKTESGNPYVLSTDWMKLWADYSRRCADFGIGLGMDDYVVASPGNGGPVDEVLATPSIKSFQGRLKRDCFPKNGEFPGNILTTKDLGDSLEIIYTVPSPELHPDYGRLMVEKYFQPFEDSMDAKGRDGMNYFFQDELIYDLDMRSWCEGMPGIFKERKGYDILLHLDALFATKDAEVDEAAAKVRLDYAEVLTQLAEERYFKPIYDWHADRGLIYGCDNEGRGLRPLNYLDYFRATSWFTAPGNDAPARGSSFRQTKVSSSIAHLYGRPRTWLEAFHSMGWDANGGVLVHQLDHHLIAGGNLLCMHGLYYSTHGGWWEWAPPSFHFRMPYWPHMKTWLKYAERMCYILSQGVHVCDIAVLYPTETMQAYPEEKPDLTFKVAMSLSDHGLDYDFIDWQSLQKADIQEGSLKISDESYKVLILAGTRAMHEESLAKVKEFERRGGLVIRVDSEEVEGLAEIIRGRIVPDFRTSSGTGKVLHRRIGDKDVYMVMDVPTGDSMFFRATGKAEQWDAFHGTASPCPVAGQSGGVSELVYDGSEDNSALFVFSPGEPAMTGVSEDRGRYSKTTVPVEGKWNIEIIPTMDNKWGDFRLPASEGKIGMEAREFTCSPKGPSSQPVTSVYGYAPYMKTLNIPSDRDLDKALESIGSAEGWKPYCFSWQYGVFDSPGSQGYHGLKEKVDDRFLILDQGCHQVFEAYLDVPSSGTYRLVRKGVEPYRVIIDGKQLDLDRVELSQGQHVLTVAYSETGKAEYELSKIRGNTRDTRDRSMVMLYPLDAPDPVPHGMYEDIVASSWYGTGFVPFVCRDGGAWQINFETAPGMVSMAFETAGIIDAIEVDGKNVPFKETGLGKTPDGHPTILYKVGKLPANPDVSTVSVLARPDKGYPGAAFFTEPVKLECSGGLMEPGDWSRAGAMKFYSGGVKYSKVIKIKEPGRRVQLDLGDVDATCEVSVNGKPVDVLLRHPYILDVSKYIRKGKNRIEVLVYSSLSNHYQSIPSPYKGTPRAGLIGPVQLILEK